MICPYCTNLIADLVNDDNIGMISCEICSTSILYCNNNILEIDINVELNKLLYFLTIDYKNDKTYISGPSFPDFERKMKNKNHTTVWKRILTLNHIVKMDINNSKSKLKTILLFS